jgi:hypothetical protein
MQAERDGLYLLYFNCSKPSIQFCCELMDCWQIRIAIKEACIVKHSLCIETGLRCIDGGGFPIQEGGNCIIPSTLSDERNSP